MDANISKLFIFANDSMLLKPVKHPGKRRGAFRDQRDYPNNHP